MIYQIILLLEFVSIPVFSFGVQKNNPCTIKICNNKDCVKRGGGDRLVQIFHDLLPGTDDVPIPRIESSGCLTKCGNGPNICVTNGSEEKIYAGIADATSASAVLDVAMDGQYPIELLVAADVISKVHNTKDMSKKEQLLSSAIAQLTKDDNLMLSQSYAHGHALYLRADIRLEKSSQDVQGALNDARTAVEFVPNDFKAWRVLASAEEAAGNIDAAILAVTKWIEVDKSFATKAKKEIERLTAKA